MSAKLFNLPVSVFNGAEQLRITLNQKQVPTDDSGEHKCTRNNILQIHD